MRACVRDHTVTQNPPPTEWFICVYWTAHTTYNIQTEGKEVKSLEKMRTARVRERERKLIGTRWWVQCRQGAFRFKSSEILKTATVVTLRLLALHAK